MIGGGIYPGMITATIGTALLFAVVATSIVIVRRRLPYEWWYTVHLLAYAGVALGWFHQIPTGNELVLSTVASDYWRGLYVATIAALVVFRVLLPAAAALRHGLRVAGVVTEGPGVVSLRIEGRRLDRLQARAGQFFIWRFLAPGLWWSAHPFSLSQLPDGRSLRITVKALGDHSLRLAEVPVGTRVVAEGPFGVFTSAVRRRAKVLLIAGGIGITPVRALVEEMHGDVVVPGDRRGRSRFPARARPARRCPRHRASLRRRRPRDRRRSTAPDGGPSPRARARHRRPRRLRVWPTGHDRRRGTRGPRRGRRAPAHPR
jgi:Ferric reductase like transmembrane component/FAD-binding domain